MLYRFTDHDRGQMSLSTSATTTCTEANVYYLVQGSWSDGSVKNFTLDSLNNKITYNGSTGCFDFAGTSDLQVDKACNVSYGLYKNGELVPGSETPHTFTGSARTHTIAIVKMIDLVKNDFFNVYVKSSEAGTVVTHNTLTIKFVSTR